MPTPLEYVKNAIRIYSLSGSESDSLRLSFADALEGLVVHAEDHGHRTLREILDKNERDERYRLLDTAKSGPLIQDYLEGLTSPLANDVREMLSNAAEQRNNAIHKMIIPSHIKVRRLLSAVIELLGAAGFRQRGEERGGA